MSSTAVAAPKRETQIGFQAALEYVVDVALLLSGFLVATYLRHSLPLGKYVGSNYQWYEPGAYAVILGAVAAAYIVMVLAGGSLRTNLRRFFAPILGTAIAVAGLTVLLPNQSGLEKIYFAASSLLLISLVVPWPSRHEVDRISLRRSVLRLWANRELLRIWVLYNIRSRYAQAVLGILWIVLVPLSTALIMSVVFSHLLRIQLHGAPFIAFFLSGIVPWGLFNQGISAGMRSILSAMGLINQIYFPREIIVLSALGEALVDMAFMFAAMLVVNAVVGVYPNIYFLVLIPLLLIQVCFTLGLMFVVSWLSVLVRDVPQLVSVLLQMIFYLCPIIYPLSIVPHSFQFLITLNPMAPIIEAYHNVVVYATAPNWNSLIYPGALGVALLIFGYRVFKRNEDRFADMV
ncbi:MAG: ABC transporter permease [Chloroflexota bacterium]